MSFIFKKLPSNSMRFFDRLPKDWQADIIPFWDYYKDSAKVYILEEKNHVVGGGIVFSTCPPDIEYYRKDAQKWFDKDYLYLGFIWIAEDKRNKNLGSLWLEELKKTNPKQKYWLMIEAEHLHHFYQKNNFKLNKTVSHNDHTEWLYSYVSL
jgi:GNAT superfamily N-acetyltransferase